MKFFEGEIISDKMPKAVAVEISFVRAHPLYHKRIKIKRKIHAQNLIGAKIGERVRIVSCRPISKKINFKVLEVIK